MENISRKRVALSTTIIAIAVVAIIVIAGVAYYFYNTSVTTSSTSTTSSVLFPTSKILTGATSAGFFNSQIVTFAYTQSFTCAPALAKFAQNQTEATRAVAVTACEVGGGDATAVPNSAPVFILVPAFAGLSIFGVTALGSTSQGYPTFKGSAVFTQCGAGGSTSACFDHPTYIYSPYFTAVEQHIGLKSGYGGLPEGVLPVPSHDHIVNYAGGNSIPWDVITVLVFDPNIMPDGASGQCQKWVNSDLANPTANCLTSFSALANALVTTTTATANANSTQSNPIYSTLGGVKTQVLIPGVSLVSDNSPANTNLFLYFSVQNKSPFG